MKKTVLAGCLFGILGFAANWFKLELFFNVDFLFGSIFVMLALLLYGAGAGLIAGILAASCTLLLWHHPWAVITFCCETLFVAWRLRRGSRNLIFSDLCYWLCLGAPLVWVLYHDVMGIPTSAAQLIILKQGVNGIMNAFAATLIRQMLRFRQEDPEKMPSLQEVIFTTTIGLVLFTALFSLIMNQREITQAQEEHLAVEVVHAAGTTRDTLQWWLTEHLKVVETLAAIVGDPNRVAPSELQRAVEITHRHSPQFVRMGVFNRDAVSVAYSPIRNNGQLLLGLNVNERPYVANMRQRRKSLIPDMVVGKVIPLSPIIPLVAPVVINGEFRGFCSAVVNPSSLRQILDSMVGGRPRHFTIVDGNNKVIVSTRSGVRPMDTFHLPPGQRTKTLESGVFQWLPRSPAGTSLMQQWRSAYFIKEIPLGEGSSWRLIAEVAVAPMLDTLTHHAINSFILILGLLAVTSLLAQKWSNWIAAPLRMLRERSGEIPSLIQKEGDLVAEIPTRRVSEIAGLIATFAQMEQALRSSFHETASLQAGLEEQVQERTAVLCKTAAWLAALKDRSPVGILVTDVNRVILDTNPSVCELFGYTPQEMMGEQSRIIHVSDETTREFGERFYYLIRSGQQLLVEIRLRRKCGDIFWAEVAGQAIVPGDLSQGAIWMIQDITARKLVEEREQITLLRQQAQISLYLMGETTFQELLDFGLEKSLELTASRVGSIYLYDEETQLFTLHSWSTEVMPARTIVEPQSPYELAQIGIWGEVVRQRTSIMVNDYAASHELNTGYPQGHIPLTRFLSIPIKQHDRIVAVVGVGNKVEPYTNDDSTQLQLFMDGLWNVVERQRSEVALRLAKNAAETANAAKSRFLANMSHEIRTPMNAVMGLGQLLQQTPLDSQQLDFIKKINSSARWLLHIIDDILDVSRVESGQMTLEQVDFSLAACLEHAANSIAGEARRKGLEFNVVTAPETPDLLRGDPFRLGQILINLLGNALKFTARGGIQLCVAPVALPVTEPITLQFQVRDTGIGLAPEQWEKIFEPFTQADNSTTRCYGGTGLGLNISKRLVELMGGKIRVEGESGRGSTFIFTATFAHGGHPVMAALPLTSVSIELPRIQGSRVLVAEDNPINQQIARILLTQAGLRVTMAGNGEEAVAAIAQADIPFDLVLMDLQMPVMDGYEAADIIRRQYPSDLLPIIAVTAHAMPSERQKCLEIGMNDHLAKPYESTELNRLLVRWLRPHSGMADEESAEKEAVSVLPVALTQLPGLDIASALLRLDLTLEFYGELFVMFCREHGNDAALMHEKLAMGDLDAVRVLAHTLKGVSGNLSALKLSASAAQLEEALKGGRVDEAGRCVSLLADHLAEVLTAAAYFQRELQETPEPDILQMDLSQLPRIFSELLRKLEERDIEAVELFDQVKQQVAHCDPVRAEQLEQAMGQLDFRRGVMVLQSLVSDLAITMDKG
jgi:two-component system, cell cycle sensor histidine kinase and response regulator CckA